MAVGCRLAVITLRVQSWIPMAHALSLASHHTVDELRALYRQATDPVEKTHWQVIWLKKQGRSTTEIGAVTDYTDYWIRTLIHRYNDGGAEAMQDQRHHHPGAPALLTDAQMADLDQALQHETPPGGGHWNGPKVARWIESATGRERVHDQRGWDYLIRLGFTVQTPRPKHTVADPAAQAALKK